MAAESEDGLRILRRAQAIALLPVEPQPDEDDGGADEDDGIESEPENINPAFVTPTMRTISTRRTTTLRIASCSRWRCPRGCSFAAPPDSSQIEYETGPANLKVRQAPSSSSGGSWAGALVR